nr:cation:proton antiporter [Aeromonas caviae]
MLGESHYRHQLEVDIKPFRDVLMGLFFITIGMTMDWALVAGAWWQVLACVTGLILCKSLLILLAGRLMGGAQARRHGRWHHVEPGRGVRFCAAGAGESSRLAGSPASLSAHRHRCHLHRPHPLAGVAGAGTCPLPHRQCPALLAPRWPSRA